MAMRISFRQLNGKAIVLEVLPDITGGELKERIKDCQLWDDELTRKTTLVDIVVGASRVLTNDETAADAGLSPESEVTVIFRQNTLTCSHKDEFAQCGQQIDFEFLFQVRIPSSATEIKIRAFNKCRNFGKCDHPQHSDPDRD